MTFTRHLPGWLLRHPVVVEAPAAGGGYAAGVTVRVAYNETAGSDVAQAGRQWETFAVTAQADAAIVAGSRVTLDDGRKGIVSAVVRHHGAGLPVPDHLDVTVKVPVFVQTTTVTIYRGDSVTGYGDTVAVNDVTTRQAVGVPASLVSTSETQVSAETGRQYVLNQTSGVLAPGTDVRVGDRLRDDITADTYLVRAVDPNPTPALAVPVAVVLELSRA